MKVETMGDNDSSSNNIFPPEEASETIAFLWSAVLEVVRGCGPLDERGICLEVGKICDESAVPVDPLDSDEEELTGRLRWRSEVPFVIGVMRALGLLVTPRRLEKRRGRAESEREGKEAKERRSDDDDDDVKEEEEEEECCDEKTFVTKDCQQEKIMPLEEEGEEDDDQEEEASSAPAGVDDSEEKKKNNPRSLTSLSGSIDAEAKAWAEQCDFESIEKKHGLTTKRAALTWVWNRSQTLPFSDKYFHLAREGHFDELEDAAGNAVAKTLFAWSYFKADDWTAKRRARTRNFDDRQLRTVQHALEQLHPERREETAEPAFREEENCSSRGENASERRKKKSQNDLPKKGASAAVPLGEECMFDLEVARHFRRSGLCRGAWARLRRRIERRRALEKDVVGSWLLDLEKREASLKDDIAARQQHLLLQKKKKQLLKKKSTKTSLRKQQQQHAEVSSSSSENIDLVEVKKCQEGSDLSPPKDAESSSDEDDPLLTVDDDAVDGFFGTVETADEDGVMKAIRDFSGILAPDMKVEDDEDPHKLLVQEGASLFDEDLFEQRRRKDDDDDDDEEEEEEEEEEEAEVVIAMDVEEEEQEEKVPPMVVVDNEDSLGPTSTSNSHNICCSDADDDEDQVDACETKDFRQEQIRQLQAIVEEAKLAAKAPKAYLKSIREKTNSDQKKKDDVVQHSKKKKKAASSENKDNDGCSSSSSDEDSDFVKRADADGRRHDLKGVSGQSLTRRGAKRRRASSRAIAPPSSRKSRGFRNDGSILSPMRPVVSTDPNGRQVLTTLTNWTKPVDWRDLVRTVQATPLVSVAMESPALCPMKHMGPPPPKFELPCLSVTESFDSALSGGSDLPGPFSSYAADTDNKKKIDAPNVRELSEPYDDGDDDDHENDRFRDDQLDPDAMLKRHALVLKTMKDRIDKLVKSHRAGHFDLLSSS